MSNCVDISTSSYCLGFASHQFKPGGIPALMGLVKEGQKFGSQLPDNPSEAQIRAWNAWWFLTPDNVIREEDSVEIYLGSGHSSHTFRDLRYTLKLIGEYLQPGTMVRLKIRDAENPELGWENIRFDITGPAPI